MGRIDRREFLKLAGAGGIGVGAGILIGESAENRREAYVPYVATPEGHAPGIDTWYNTVCDVCSAGCGISVRIREGRAKKIEGNPLHPVSQGKTCARGQAGLNVLYNPDRVTAPRRGADGGEQLGWDAALGEVAAGIKQAIAQGGPQSVYLLSGGRGGHVEALTRRFLRAVGSPNFLRYDFAAPEALSKAGEIVFGETQLPYYDIANAQTLFSFGADFLGTWLSPVHYSLAYGRFRQGANRRRGHFVQIEPRMSMTAANADQWVAAKPGTEGMLALAIAQHIVASGRYRGADRTSWARTLSRFTPAHAAPVTGIAAEQIQTLAARFADQGPSLAIGGGCAAAATNGVANLVAINALNVLAGNLGRPGGVLFNPEPAIEAEQGLETSGFAAVMKLLEDIEAGRVGALLIDDCNPAHTLPGSMGFGEALQKVPFVASLSRFVDETSRHAKVILPLHSALESWWDLAPEPGVGMTVAALAQPVVRPLHDTRSPAGAVLGLAQAMGGAVAAELPWASGEDYLRDTWRVAHVTREHIDDPAAFEDFWGAVLQAGVWGQASARDVRRPKNLTAVQHLDYEAPEFAGDAGGYPFHLQPYLSQALYDGRHANLPWLQELPDPLTGVVYGSWIEVSPTTAADLDLREGEVLQISSPEGSVEAPVVVYPGLRPDVVAMPIGQGHESFGRYATGRGANPLEVVANRSQTLTGALAWGATRVQLAKTGRRVRLVKTAGMSRDLGRQILGPSGGHGDAGDDH